MADERRDRRECYLRDSGPGAADRRAAIDDNVVEQVRLRGEQLERDRAAERHADDVRRPCRKVGDQPRDEGRGVLPARPLDLPALAVPGEIRCDAVVTVRQRREVVLPHLARTADAVQEHDRGRVARSRLADVERSHLGVHHVDIVPPGSGRTVGPPRPTMTGHSSPGRGSRQLSHRRLARGTELRPAAWDRRDTWPDRNGPTGPWADPPCLP